MTRGRVEPKDVAADRRAAEVRKLSTLVEISQALAGTLDLRPGLHRALELLEQHHSVVNAAVTLRDEENGDLDVVAANPRAPGAARASAGSGSGSGGNGAATGKGRSVDHVTDQVIRTGRSVVIPDIDHEPLLKAKLGDRSRPGHRSFIAVPILLNRRPAGALTVELAFKSERLYDRSAKFFGVVASMIGQALKVQKLIEAERQRLVDENVHLRQELRERYDFSNLVGTSNAIRQVYEQVAQVARTSTTVLIRGESGTGKELIAHAIHYNSLRARKPFVKVSCGALPDTLMESELFGYEKGAFTDAHARRKGRFELAEGGTLFLDEIGDINLPTQVKLLRVLQEREFERLGGTETVKVNVRLIAATNKALEPAIEGGTFREDLYYRLNVFTIFVPPLRERKTDILLCADHFLQKFAREHGKAIRRIATPAIDMLMSYHWPGNVRELENTIERAVLVCDGHAIHAHHLPPTLQTATSSDSYVSQSLKDATDAYERDVIQDALKTARGNRARAARMLQTTERILNYKVRKHRIDYGRFKQ
jgi:Nif-specific regulatory protein